MNNDNDDAQIQEIRRRLQNAQAEHAAERKLAIQQKMRARFKVVGAATLMCLAAAIIMSILAGAATTYDEHPSHFKKLNHDQ